MMVARRMLDLQLWALTVLTTSQPTAQQHKYALCYHGELWLITVVLMWYNHFAVLHDEHGCVHIHAWPRHHCIAARAGGLYD